MQGAKPWWWSKLMWLGIAQIIAGIAGMYGHDLDADAMSDQFYQLLLIVNGGLTIAGRAVTKQPVTLISRKASTK